MIVVVLTGIPLALRLRRLSARQAYSRDAPYSTWRVLKSSFVVAGWAVAGGLYLWAKVGWALGAVADMWESLSQVS